MSDIKIESSRLKLVKLTTDDWSFVLELLNQPDYISHIRDSQVRNAEQARHFIQTSYIASYEKNGFGLYGVELKSTAQKIGVCGLIKRDTLPHIDLGFALLSTFQGSGYAEESAKSTLQFAREHLRVPEILAIVTPANQRSIRLLRKLDFEFQKQIQLKPEQDEILDLYSLKLRPRATPLI